MSTHPPVDLSEHDLQGVAAFSAFHAESVLALFESARPLDARPREAVAAAWVVAQGERRSARQRLAAAAAHRAARGCRDEAAGAAARAAGDAAASVYLHPFAASTQVRHLLGATAHAAWAKELACNGDSRVGEAYVQEAARQASPQLVEVLRRYPVAPASRTRGGHLMALLDRALRAR